MASESREKQLQTMFDVVAKARKRYAGHSKKALGRQAPVIPIARMRDAVRDIERVRKTRLAKNKNGHL
jgi:hypothetical protein